MNKTPDEYCEDLCKEIDDLAHLKCAVDSPIYQLQQGLIAAAEWYRKRKELKNE